MNDYVGIAGFVTDPTVDDRVSKRGRYGIAASNGVFQPTIGVQLKQISDGTSNTMLVGEQSGTQFSPAGEPLDLRSGMWAGGWLGMISDSNDEGCTELPTQDSKQWGIQNRCYWAGLTTIRYAIGVNGRPAHGARDPWDVNQPLNSHHPGGVHVLRCDGGVTFMENGTSPEVLRPLAVRDDGDVLIEGFGI